MSRKHFARVAGPSFEVEIEVEVEVGVEVGVGVGVEGGIDVESRAGVEPAARAPNSVRR